MSKAQQIRLNIQLSDKLANFLITQPEILKKYTGCSYVVFSSKNPQLNKLNSNLIEELLSEGNEVVKAEETGNLSDPWEFTPVN
ncbi:MAG: hypothetical protein Q7S61_04245 [bacterium]|nr:hypothetical protein [bacterium]